MPAKHTAKPMPCDPVSPSNPITIQCRVNPGEFYNTPIDQADYLAPPFTLVFAKKDAEKTKGVDAGNFSLKRKRGGDVHDVITNMYNVGEGDRVPKTALRCIGVTYDGVLNARDAKNHPDKVARLAVIVSGAVTIVCNKEDLDGLSVGDMLEWHMEDNGLIYNGLSPQWSTARIGKASGGHGILDLDRPYEAMFGPKRPFTIDDIDQLKKQISLLKSFVRSTFVEQAWYEGTTPKQMAEAAAHLMFSSIDKKLESRDEWIKLIYRNPSSGYYSAFPEPQSEDSIMWGVHCFGDATGAGWLQLFIDGKNDWLTKDDKDKLTQIKSLSSPPSQDSKEYFTYKSLNNMELDADEMAMMHAEVHYGELTPTETKKIGKFIAPLIIGKTTISSSSKAITRVLTSNRPSSTTDVSNYRNLSKTGFDFFNITSQAAVLAKSTNGIDAIGMINNDDNREFRKEAFARALNLRHDGGSSNMFGMLLEKCHHSNEARVLLCPGGCM